MKFRIKHEAGRRIQFSTSPLLFTEKKAYGLENILGNLEFVDDAVVNWRTGYITVKYQEGYREELINRLFGVNFKDIEELTRNEGNLNYWMRREFQDKLIAKWSIRTFMKTFMPPFLGYVNIIRGGLPIIFAGLKSIKNRKLDVNVLDMTAVLGSLVIGDIGSANSAIFYLEISELLEDYTERKTKLDLGRSLVFKAEKVWKIMEDGSEELVDMAEVSVGDTILVYSGNLIPVDGIVIDGPANVDQSTMTGESEAVSKEKDDSVFAGTVVVEGNLKVRVTALENETRLSKIVDMIYDGSEQKAKAVAKAEKLADKIVPYSLGAAVLASILTRNIRKGIAVLMVDYSCALRLTVPLSIMTALREALDRGVLVRGGKYLEAYNDATAIVFDKTGTLTEACPKVQKVVALEGFKEEEVLRDIACIEEHFPHSMARAIVNYALERGIKHRELHTEVNYIVAHGIVTTLNGHKAMVGSRHFLFDDEGIPMTDELKNSLKENQNTSSVIYFALDNKPAGYILLEDPPRKEAKGVIEYLIDSGVKDVWMLTGDDEMNASSLAEKLSINNYMAQVLPEDKANKVEEIAKVNKSVVMVGDGINDSPALAKANVSIAMKDGSDLAKEVSDVVILNSDLNSLIVLRELSSKTMKRIDSNYRNIIFFNTALILMGIGGITTVTMNSFLHNFSTFIFGSFSVRPYLLDIEPIEEK